MTVTIALAALGALALSAFGTGLLRGRAGRWGLVDVPNARSMHTRVTPRGGGIGLVLAVLAGLVIAVLGAATLPAQTAAFAAVAVVVALVGWRDDVRSMAPMSRLVAHTAAAAVAIAVWGVFDRVALPLAGTLDLPMAVAALLTGLWLVGLLNAYNFMDGIDGIAAGQAVVAGVMWVLLAGTSAPLATAAAALIAAASLGFLAHNWQPARIFMGDAGSGFLGFAFALVALVAYHATREVRLPVAGVLVVAPFVFDTSYTMILRIARRERLFEAHRGHLYQRLVLGGLSHASVAVLYIVMAAACGAAAVAWVRGAGDAVLAVPAAAVLVLPLLTSIIERRGRS